MGCDIHSFSEKKVNGKYISLNFAPFDWRSYGMYGFLADVRNYSAIPPISRPRGIPEDLSNIVKKEIESWEGDGHSHSWLIVEELIAFDYDAEIEDRRYMKQVGPNAWDGGATAEPGQGKKTSWREFLDEQYFKDLAKLEEIGADRIVFWFDN